MVAAGKQWKAFPNTSDPPNKATSASARDGDYIFANAFAAALCGR
jgi:hypothetical protein